MEEQLAKAAADFSHKPKRTNKAGKLVDANSLGGPCIYLQGERKRGRRSRPNYIQKWLSQEHLVSTKQPATIYS